MKRLLSLLITLLFIFLACEPSLSAAGEVVLPLTALDTPGGAWDGPPVRPALKMPEPLWSLRTGPKKGITDLTMEEEIFGAPDAAVLRAGLYPEWTGLLAEFRESSVLVEPDGLAGLSGTKPLLIIPSGGLAGSSSSAFFRAGLADYARSGGVILCFTQQQGGDYAALPVPEGSKLEAAGWSQDAGPLFRSSLLQDDHPVLAEMRKMTPYIETDGYLISYPANTRVLLARQDGHPTFVLYPYGSGWVAVTTLMSDLSFAQGLLADDERTLVRDLLLWAKSGGRAAPLAADRQLDLNLGVRGSEKGKASSVRIMVMASSREKPLHERAVPISLGPSQETSVRFTYGVPADAPPGIYHLEYVLLDEKGMQLGLPAESGQGWLLVPSDTQPPTRVVGTQQPLAVVPAAFSAAPVVEAAGDQVRLTLDVVRTSGPPGTYDLFARVAGLERYFRIAQDRGTVSFEIPASKTGKRIGYAVYHTNGRCLVRGSVAAGLAQKNPVAVDRQWYLPGQTVKVSVTGLGPGEATLTGLGSEQNQLISTNKIFEMPVHASLPSGTYPLSWEFQSRTGERKAGEIPVLVRGAQARFTDVSFLKASSPEGPSLATSLRLSSSHALKALLRLQLTGPAGTPLPARETAVQLIAGSQEITQSLPFKPDQAGIWHVAYTLSTVLPEGAGLPRAPITLASGRVLIDAGDAAVLGVRTARPVYYEASGPVEIAAVVAGRERSRVELFLDGKRIRKEKLDAPGPVTMTAPLTGLSMGAHTLRAVAAAGDLESVREVRFVYGASIPDLTASIQTSDPNKPVMEVGVGVANKGKAASGKAEVSLYEGDPDKGGRLIQQVAVPPLAPGAQQVVVISWPLAGKAGPRTLVAVVDREQRITEPNKGNNAAAVSVTVPDVLLTLMPEKTSYRADESVRYKIGVANFTTGTFPSLILDIQITDPAGKVLSTDAVALRDFAPGAQKLIDRAMDIPAPLEGTYLITAKATSQKVLATDSLGITLLPTLLLKGSLEGTPAGAAPCRPLTIAYRVRNAGNLPPTNGTVKIEIRSAGMGQIVYAQQLPFALDARTNRIDKVAFPRGAYTVTLRASAANQRLGVTADFLLAEQPLTVGGPVEVKRSDAALPRVLIWSGGENTSAIEQAIMEKILKEAFDSESVYLRTVSTPEDFANQALTGRYNVYLIFEISGMLDAADAIRTVLARGHGVVLAGSGERARLMAEALDFRFGDPLPPGTASITFPPDSALGITGTVPVSGRVLTPRKKGAAAVAALPDGRPAILLDRRDKGRIISMPFSLAQSALNTGTTTLYSLLLRSAVLAVVPEHEERGTIFPVQLTVSSPTGPVKARILETLPPGAKVVWTSVKSTIRQNTLTFEMTADTEPQKVLYLIERGDAAGAGTATEVISECDGRFVSQGQMQ